MAIRDITWNYSGQSDEMIALYSHGAFFAQPSFAHRVEHTTNAGKGAPLHCSVSKTLDL